VATFIRNAWVDAVMPDMEKLDGDQCHFTLRLYPEFVFPWNVRADELQCFPPRQSISEKRKRRRRDGSYGKAGFGDTLMSPRQ
jgi:hypothetical protein